MLIAWSAVEIISVKYPGLRRYRGIVLVGAILPDLGNFTLLLGEAGSQLSYYFFPLHSPVGIGLLVLGLSFAARKKRRRVALYLLALGAFLHFAADYLIVTLAGKLPLLFPLSFKLYDCGIFLQGGWTFLIISGALAAVSTGVARILKKAGFGPS